MKAISSGARQLTSDSSFQKLRGAGGLPIPRSLGPALPLCLGLLIGPGPGHAATHVVTSIQDSGPGSLREIVANADPEGTVTFDPSLNGQILMLTSGEVAIQKSLSLLGPGAASLTINGNGTSRLFTFAAGTTNLLSGLTLTKGKAPDGVMDFLNPGNREGRPGGAIYSAGTLTLRECILNENQSGAGAAGQGGMLLDEGIPAGPGGSGGAIFATGPLTLIRCTLSENRGGDGGTGGPGMEPFIGSGAPGGPGSDGGAGGEGGAIYVTGPLILNACTLNGNRTGVGGNGGAGSAGNNGNGASSQFLLPAGNGGAGGGGGHGGKAGRGGAIHATSSARLELCTLSGNHSTQGGQGGKGGAGGQGGSGDPGFPPLFPSFPPGSKGPNGEEGSGGEAGAGGGIFAATGLTLNACTIAANISDAGGNRGDGQPGTPGVGGGVRCGSDPALMWNTLVTGNSSDVLGNVSSQGYNLIGRIEGCTGVTDGVKGDRAGTAGAPLDSLLGPLASNGGPTQTHALLRGSPAMDAGDPAFEVSPFPTDQRYSGFSRISNHRIDIGAYEVQEPKTTQLRHRLEGVEITIQGESNETLVIEWNSEARTDGWQTLTTGGTDETGLLEVRDSNSKAPRRFYRSFRR